MIPEHFVVGTDPQESPDKMYFARFTYNRVEYGFATGSTKEEALIKLADQVCGKLIQINDTINSSLKDLRQKSKEEFDKRNQK